MNRNQIELLRDIICDKCGTQRCMGDTEDVLENVSEKPPTALALGSSLMISIILKNCMQ